MSIERPALARQGEHFDKQDIVANDGEDTGLALLIIGALSAMRDRSVAQYY
jgi:hypothetical protein